MSTTMIVYDLYPVTTMKSVAMKSFRALFAAVVLGAGIGSATSQTDLPIQADGKQDLAKPASQAEDSLPAGSVLRLGTSRFRLGLPVSSMAVSPNGKWAIAVNADLGRSATRVFDLVSGQPLYSLGGLEGTREGTIVQAGAFSPDGRTLVTKQDFSLRVRDAATGKELRKIDLKRATKITPNKCLSFTPDGKAIAVTSQGSVIHLIDCESGETIRDFQHTGQSGVLGIAISRDGKWMAAGGYDQDIKKNNYFAKLWNLETGKYVRPFPHGLRGRGIGAVAFSPDAKTLATAGDEGILRLFDVETGAERNAFPKNGSFLRQGAVAFSPDGKTLALAGESIRFYDATTFEERLRIDRRAIGLHFAEDGNTLTGAVNGAIYRWDTATGKALTHEAAGDSIVEQILVAPDGARVVTRGQIGDAHFWNAATGEHLRHIPTDGQRGLAMSPDGRFLVWRVADPSVTYTDPARSSATYTGNKLKLYDLAADRFVERFPGFEGDAQSLSFAADGKTLVTVDHQYATVNMWDVAAGKVSRSFRVARENEKGSSYQVASSSLSPDGATLVVTYRQPSLSIPTLGAYSVWLYDVATGKKRNELAGHMNYGIAPIFSPDGKWLITTGADLGPVFQNQLNLPANQMLVWDVATGARIARLPDGLPTRAAVVAFSRDGRTVAFARGDDFGGGAERPEDAGKVQLYETATWTIRAELRGDQGRATALAFAPNGRLLVGGRDTTVLAWDVRPPRVLETVSLETAWDNLGKTDAGESFKTEGKFLAAPADTVKLFAEKIRPAEVVDPKRIVKLLADLGSDVFNVREAATKALQEAEGQARSDLEKSLKSEDSLEGRRRMKSILDRLQGGPMTADQLRQVRGVMVLELIGSGESKSLLKKWAGGPAETLLTVEAAAALQRLDAEPKVTPIPDEVVNRYKLDTDFYKKHLDYNGFSILSSEKVSDAGLYEARYLIDKLLGEREDILKAMIESGCRFMVMAPTEMTTDVPEQRRLKNDPKTDWDKRARGLGGKLSSCGEENLLNLKGDRYKQENILIHEFNHAIHQQGLRIVDPTFNRRLKEAYDNAKSMGLWKGTYVIENPAEYWAEAAQAYFDCMRPGFGANTREKLEKYDPDLFKLVDEVYKQSKYRYVRYDQRK